MTRSYYVILVPSTSYAVRGEHVLNQQGIASKLIPVPRNLSSDCGVCIRVLAQDLPAARQALDAAKVPYDSVHEF
jgi:bacterioferritin-associated ferredoxin